MKNDKSRCVVKIALFILILILERKIGIISVPCNNEMIDYQFGLITISTVFAGFSFTVLGLLLGMFSEPVIKKLQGTTIVTDKSKKLMISIFYFCISGLVSLFFITEVDAFIIRKLPNLRFIVEYIFVAGILFLMIGIIYFVKSTIGVFNIISKIYDGNIKKYEKMKVLYENTKR